MTRRSRLRTHEVKRRRLFLLVPMLLAIIGGLVWYGGISQSPLLEQALEFFSLEGWRSTENRDLVRGTIYDRNYKELAVSYERVSVYANIREIENLDQVVEPLADVLEEGKEVLYERLSGNNLRLWLAKDISQEQEDKIRQLDLPGIFLHKEYVRYHPQKESAAHLVGFVEKDTGLSGIEYYLNQLQTKHRINRGRLDSLPQVGDGRPGADGRHLILTLDLKIQRILDRYLGKFVGKSPDFKMGALVMEAGSGALIGYSQVPSFDPNRFHTYPEAVISGIFNETMAVPEPFKVFLRDVSLLESQSDHGRRPLPWSIAAEKRKLGIQLMLWEKLGAGSNERYDFISASPVMSKRVAHDMSGSGHMSYETVPVMQTPLQLVTAMARSVNEGVAIIPHAADRYVVRRNQSEFLLEDLEGALDGGLLHDGVSSEAQLLLKVLMPLGPLDSAIVEGNSVSYSMNGGMKAFKRHYLFMALVPAQKPELILMIVSSESGYGPEAGNSLSQVSEARKIIAPIVALQKVMKNLADMMKPREREETNFHLTTKEERETKVGSEADKGLPTTVEMVMPSLEGMSLRKSLRLFQGMNVEVEIRGTGRVVEQQPATGSTLASGARVVLVLERGVEDMEPEHNRTNNHN